MYMLQYVKTLTLVEDIPNSFADSKSGSFSRWLNTLWYHSLGTDKGVYKCIFHRCISAMAGRRPYGRRDVCIFQLSTVSPPDPHEMMLK